MGGGEGATLGATPQASRGRSHAGLVVVGRAATRNPHKAEHRQGSPANHFASYGLSSAALTEQHRRLFPAIPTVSKPPRPLFPLPLPSPPTLTPRPSLAPGAVPSVWRACSGNPGPLAP